MSRITEALRVAFGRLVELAMRYTQLARMLWRVAPKFTTISLLCTVIGATATALSMVAAGWLIGGLYRVIAHGAGTGAMWMWFGVFAGAMIVGQLVQAVVTWSNPRIWAAYRVEIEDLMAEAGMHSRSLEPLDSGIGRELAVISDSSRDWIFLFGMTGAWLVLSTRLVGVGSIVILLSWRWWVPFAVAGVFLVESRMMSIWMDFISDRLYSWPSIDRQRADYVAKVMTAAGWAKEVRLFGIAGWLSERYVRLWNAASNSFWREANRRLALFLVAEVPTIAVVGGSLALLGYDAYHGRVSGATVTTYVLALLALEAFGQQGDEQIGLVRITNLLRNLGRLRHGLGLPRLTPGAGPPRAKSNVGESDIRFNDVVFTYPTRTEPTLRRLSLDIPAGQSIAIVGVNGAGKSTMIKLLAGLYQTDSGSISIGGRDVFHDESVRGKVAVIFQDFVHYPLSLRDNVGFGAVDHRNDTQLLERALSDAGGADVFDQLDHDWDTILSREFAGGTDLSGGQWQRVALARALAAVAGGAQILVLDEPTAALDVRAEAALFDRFLDVTGGVTTILVSHRLSTVRHAERIVVLDGATGHITEDGSHEQLMVLGGEYATMFTLQATRFAQAGTVDET